MYSGLPVGGLLLSAWKERALFFHARETVSAIYQWARNGRAACPTPPQKGGVKMRQLAAIAVVFALSLGVMAMGGTKVLTEAKRAKKDEFYTQRVDIENELRHYRAHFAGKVVLCNCDDPRQSEFFKYFAENFEKLKLKRLIATCYKSQDVDLFSQGQCERAIKQVYEGDKNGNMIVDDDEVGVFELNGDGDFRSEECIEILKEADVVVTNPPFSLFREYVAQLMKYSKKFLIIGNKNAITCSEVFQLIKENQIWPGVRGFAGGMWFRAEYEGKTDKIINGKRFVNVPSIWFTNLDHGRRHEPLPLLTMEDNIIYSKHKEIKGKQYVHYENYDAIDVPYSDAIPSDYEGLMGVPISFLDKYCPEQFEIIGQTQGDSGKELGLKPYPRELKKLNPSLRDGQLYYIDENGIPQKPYARILIRKKQ